MKTISENEFWPCILIGHEDRHSIILSDFHYFDDYFKEKDCGGYTIEKLARKLVRENGIKGIKFDSEAGMFCAYSGNPDHLLALCRLFRDIVGDEKDYIVPGNVMPSISLDQAEELLIKGFVQGLDREAQDEFLEKVPFPSLTNKQSGYLHSIKNGTDDADKIYAAKRINSEARTKTRNWKHYLSHPGTITIFLEALDRKPDPKVYQELIWALVFICMRHLPDMRVLPYFMDSLTSKNAQTRLLGLWGLRTLYSFPLETVLTLKNDRSEKVREYVAFLANRTDDKSFPVWMFRKGYDKKSVTDEES